MDEIWKDVVGYEGLYQVSDMGQVRSLNWRGSGLVRNMYLKPTHDGYRQVVLYKDGKGKTSRVHRLVAEAFIPNPENLPLINHKDEVASNNCVSNLEWCTHSYNMRYWMNLHPEKKELSDAVRRKKKESFGRKRGPYKLTSPVLQRSVETDEVIRRWDSLYEAYDTNGWWGASIKACCEGKRKTAYGYRWEYAT